MMEKSFEEIKNNIKIIRDNIINCSINNNINPTIVKLMAVTKTNTPEKVNCAIEAGINLLGENRVQEYLSKIYSYKGNYTVNFIGHLQKNKVKQIIDKVDIIESVDSISLAKCIDLEANKKGIIKKILLEINIGKEATKTGFFIEEINDAIIEISELKNIVICGLMCIPPDSKNKLITERFFEKMHTTFIDINDKKLDNVKMEILSMGMSNDYNLAIKHGSTQIRIGRGIFGERNYNL